MMATVISVSTAICVYVFICVTKLANEVFLILMLTLSLWFHGVIV